MNWYNEVRPQAQIIGVGLEEVVRRQLTLYRELGLVDPDRDVIQGEEGTEYPFPTVRQIDERLAHNWVRRYESKLVQGFDTLIIIPGACGMKALLQALQKVIDTANAPGRYLLRTTWDEGIQPLQKAEKIRNNWPTEASLLYRHGDIWTERLGHYRCQTFPGFHLLLVRPADTQITRTRLLGPVWHRPSLEMGQSALEYAKTLEQSGPYLSEHGLDADALIMCALLSIHETGIIPAVFAGSHGSACLGINNRLVQKEAPDLVPLIGWSLIDKQLILTCAEEKQRRPYYALRTGVTII